MKEASVDGWQRRLNQAADLLTGETVGQTILRLRMDASQLLWNEGATVTETPTAVGFGTPQSFARVFRRHTGLTPSMQRSGTFPSGAT